MTAGAPPYSETAAPNPLNVYGRQKTQAETAILDHWPEALVCRLPLMVGTGPYAKNNFTVNMLTAIAGNQAVTLYEDEFRTPGGHLERSPGNSAIPRTP